jgi:hypothetical protein
MADTVVHVAGSGAVGPYPFVPGTLLNAGGLVRPPSPSTAARYASINSLPVVNGINGSGASTVIPLPAIAPLSSPSVTQIPAIAPISAVNPSGTVSPLGSSTVIPSLPAVLPPPLSAPQVTALPVVLPLANTTSMTLPTVVPLSNASLSLPTLMPLTSNTVILPQVMSSSNTVILPQVMSSSNNGMVLPTIAPPSPRMTTVVPVVQQLYTQVPPPMTLMPPILASSDSGFSQEISTIASKLLKRGIVMYDQIVVRNDQGQVTHQFIKGITKLGDKVLILLDTGNLDSPNITAQISTNSTIIPFSLKTSVHECSKTELCGVVFDCQGEMCTLIRKSGSLAPQEITFKIQQRGSNAVGSISSSDGMYSSIVNTYPIVLWSELMGNMAMNDRQAKEHKYLMLKYIDVVSQRITAHISASVDMLLDKTIEASKMQQTKLELIDQEVFQHQKRKKIIVLANGQEKEVQEEEATPGLRELLKDSINKLRSFVDGYAHLDQIPDDYLGKYEATKVNLSYRKIMQRKLNEMLNDFSIRELQHINAANERLNMMLIAINDIRQKNASFLSE